MCGIAGFSMSKTSTVNTRELAHNLLSAIQTRGTHSSGFAFSKGYQTGVYKKAVPGSELTLHELPRRAEAVVLHTRFATQGAVQDNRNNHPVMSPNGHLALVHNGVISNDFDFRYGPDAFRDLPAVDTAVIPALIERDGVKDGVAQIEGYAAISWLDNRDKDSRLHLARLDYSPVAFTWLLDGSFVFASTQPLLAGALAFSGLDHGHIFDMPEEQYLQVVGGIIMESEEGIEMQPDSWAMARYASATAGGYGSESNPNSSNIYGIGSSFGNIEFNDDEYSDEEDAAIRSGNWEDDYRSQVSFDADEIAMAMAPETNRREVWLPNAETGELELAYQVSEKPDLQGFYIELEDGTLEFYDTLDALEIYLAFLAQLDLFDDAPFPSAPRGLRWTNFVRDMGEVTESRGMESWLVDLGMLDNHESRGVYNLGYIREGLTDLVTLLSL